MSCSSHGPTIDTTDILARLKTLSSAEDFFSALGVTYDPKVVQVARLHILKRMGQYLASEDVEGLPDAMVAARCKAVLERAYDDFVASSPLKQRVFKVLKEYDPDAPKAKVAFVDFEDVLKPIPAE